MTVTVAVAILVASACAVALTVTVPPLGTVSGAVYNPDALMLPFALPPTTDQLTPVLVEPVRLAVNCLVCPV